MPPALLPVTLLTLTLRQRFVCFHSPSPSLTTRTPQPCNRVLVLAHDLPAWIRLLDQELCSELSFCRSLVHYANQTVTKLGSVSVPVLVHLQHRLHSHPQLHHGPYSLLPIGNNIKRVLRCRQRRILLSWLASVLTVNLCGSEQHSDSQLCSGDHQFNK